MARSTRQAQETFAHTARRCGSGFTLVELLVVIATISILAAILMPALQKARSSAQAAACANNLRQIAFASSMYTDDNNGYVCGLRHHWYTLNATVTDVSWQLAHYLNNQGTAWLCPESGILQVESAKWFLQSRRIDTVASPDSNTFFTSMQLYCNIGLGRAFFTDLKQTRIRNPAGLIHFADTPTQFLDGTALDGFQFDGRYIESHMYPDRRACLYPRHALGTNILFTDGHVKWHAARETATWTGFTATNPLAKHFFNE